MGERTRQLFLTLSILAVIGASALQFLPGDVVGWGRIFLIETVLAPVTYTISFAAAWVFARGNKHVFWLLLLAPLAFWRAAEHALVMVIWTLGGGMV